MRNRYTYEDLQIQFNEWVDEHSTVDLLGHAFLGSDILQTMDYDLYESEFENWRSARFHCYETEGGIYWSESY